MSANTVENVKRLRAEGKTREAEAMLRALQRHDGERGGGKKMRQKGHGAVVDDRATCTTHRAHGHQEDCWWCRRLEKARAA